MIITITITCVLLTVILILIWEIRRKVNYFQKEIVRLYEKQIENKRPPKN